MKKQLCLIAVYIGELKYYERLFPYLADEYDIQLLFIRPDDKRRRQLIKYSKENNYNLSIIDYNLGKSNRASFPLISPLVRYYCHTKKCQKFFRDNSISVLIGSKIYPTVQSIFKEANYLGIETLIIQRGHTPPPNRYVVREDKSSPFIRVYIAIVEALRRAVDLLVRGPRYASTTSMPSRVGAIGREGKAVLPARFGYHPDTIEVLGSVEHQRMIELMKRLTDEPSYKKSLQKKYACDPRKKHILIVSGWYDHYVNAITVRSEAEQKEQIAYFEDIIKIIRIVFSEEEAHIHFKMHPAEENIYESYEKYGVSIHGIDSKIDELLSLSNLYISYPITSANYMVVASGTPALLVNFSPLQTLNRSAGDFNITSVITDKKKFKEALQAFKNGTLEPQYDITHIVPDSIDRTIKFIKGLPVKPL